MKSYRKILLFSSLIIIIGIVAYIFFSNSKEKIGAFEQTQNGFEFVNDEVSFSFENSEQLADESITVFKINSNSDPGKYVNWQMSKAYLLSGKTEQFTGKINIKFALTNQITEKVDLQTDLSKRLCIVVQEKSFLGSKIVWTNKLLSTEINLKQNTATASFSLANFAHIANKNEEYEVAFFLILFDNNIVHLKSRPSETDFEGNFEGIIDFPKPNLVRALKILDVIEHQWNKLQVLGFNVEKFERPIQVRFASLSEEEPVRVFHQQNYTGRIIVEVDSKTFLQNDIKDIEPKLLENFKLNLGRNFFSAYQNSLCNFTWWNVATSAWFEPIAMGEALHIPKNLPDNLKYITSPLIIESNPENEDTQEQVMHQAYASAMFVSYLSVRTNNVKTIGKIFENLGMSKNPSVPLAIQKATDGKKVEKFYPDYLDFCHRKPELLFPGLNFKFVDDNLVHDKISGKVSPNGIDWDIDKISEGNTCEAGKDAALTFTYRISAMAAQTLKILLNYKNDDVKRQFIENEHTFTLRLEGNKFTGALVYKYNGQQIIPLFIGNKYLTPDGLNKLTIKDISSLYIIFYNTDLSEINTEKKKEIVLKLDVN